MVQKEDEKSLKERISNSRGGHSIFCSLISYLIYSISFISYIINAHIIYIYTILSYHYYVYLIIGLLQIYSDFFPFVHPTLLRLFIIELYLTPSSFHTRNCSIFFDFLNKEVYIYTGYHGTPKSISLLIVIHLVFNFPLFFVYCSFPQLVLSSEISANNVTPSSA
jgi:hypothetical protein